MYLGSSQVSKCAECFYSKLAFTQAWGDNGLRLKLVAAAGFFDKAPARQENSPAKSDGRMSYSSRRAATSGATSGAGNTAVMPAQIAHRAVMSA